jgi:hypothetical protein
MRTIFALLLLFAPLTVSAATVAVEFERAELRVGDTVRAHIVIDTEGERLNAFEGALTFPLDIVSLERIEEGGDGVVRFSGITPGGYAGERGVLFTAVFRGGAEGVGRFSFDAVRSFLNDGAGTEARVTYMAFNAAVSNDAAASSDAAADAVPPEPFTLTVSRSSDAFDGQPFLVFQAQDKDSGIARYEACIGIFASCRSAESPLLLERTDVLITVKAFDHDGNERTARLFTYEAKMRYALYAFAGILILIAGAFALRRFTRIS